MKKYFITGIVILLPLAVTIAIVMFIVNFLTQPFIGWVSDKLATYGLLQNGFLFLSSEQLIRYGSQLIILLALFAFTLALGMVTRWFFFKTLINLSDQILHRIPIVNKVYKTTQEIIRTIFVSDKNSFKQVVLVRFPAEGSYSLGLVSREAPVTCSNAANQDLITVFIMTAPNPTTGYLVMYKKEDVIYVDIKPEDAVKYIVSCGIILPGSPTKDILPQ